MAVVICVNVLKAGSGLQQAMCGGLHGKELLLLGAEHSTEADLFCSSFQVVTIKLCCVAVAITTFATAVFFQRRIKLCTPPYFGIRQLGRTSIAAVVATGVRKAFLLSPFPTSDSPTCCCCCCCCCTLSLLNASFAFGSSLYLLPLVVRVLPFRLGHATR